MSRELIVLVILVVCGVVFGWTTAQSSLKREKIHSSGLARVFHYLSSALMAALTPAVLLFIFVLHLPFLTAIGIAISMFALSVLFLVPFAFLEKPALEAARAKEDRGWTEKDARESGL